jgi:hypothetical protein
MQQLREDIEAQQERLISYRRTLAHYLRQKADLGDAQIPPGIANGIADARENIHQIKSTLRSWGVEVGDHPDDERRKSLSGYSFNEVIRFHGIYISRMSFLILTSILILFFGVLLWSFSERNRMLSVINDKDAQISLAHSIQATQQTDLIIKNTEIASERLIQTVQSSQITALQNTTIPINKNDGRIENIPFAIRTIVNTQENPDTKSFTSTVQIYNNYPQGLIYKINYALPPGNDASRDGFVGFSLDFNTPHDLSAYRFIEMTVEFNDGNVHCDVYMEDVKNIYSGYSFYEDNLDGVVSDIAFLNEL